MLKLYQRLTRQLSPFLYYKKNKLICTINQRISSANLVSLLNKYPNIHTFNLSCDLLMDSTLEIDLPLLNELQVIKISDSNINGRFLSQIIQASANLQSLDINCCWQLSDVEFISLTNLIKLQTIQLDYTNFNPQAFAQLIANGPNIRSISFNVRYNFNLPYLPKFNHLSTLCLPYGYLNGSALAQIIKQAPLLKNDKSSYKFLLSSCLSSFKKFHPAIAHVAQLLAEQLRDDITVNGEDMETFDWVNIFTLDYSFSKKIQIFFSLDNLQQETLISLKQIRQAIDLLIAAVLFSQTIFAGMPEETMMMVIDYLHDYNPQTAWLKRKLQIPEKSQTSYKFSLH